MGAGGEHSVQGLGEVGRVVVPLQTQLGRHLHMPRVCGAVEIIILFVIVIFNMTKYFKYLTDTCRVSVEQWRNINKHLWRSYSI